MANWAWVAANTSLIVPAIFIGFAAYILFKDRQEAVDRAYGLLIKSQIKLIEVLLEDKQSKLPVERKASGAESK